MWVIIEGNRSWEKHRALRLLQNRKEKLLTKSCDFFLLLQGNYSFLFPFRQWAAKWDAQESRLHLHPGRASAANCGPADPGETSDFAE